MNPIYQALESGYSEEEILGFLSKAIPGISSPIKKARSAGHSIKQILGFLSKNFDNENRKGMSESEIHAANNRADAERTKYGLNALATGVGAYALSRAVPNILQGLRAGTQQQTFFPATTIPSALSTQSPPPIAEPTKQLPQQPPISGAIPAQLDTTNISQLTQNKQHEEKIIDAKALLDKYQSAKKVEELTKAGNGAELVGAYFKKFHPSIVKDIEKESGQPFESVVDQFVQGLPSEEESHLPMEKATSPVISSENHPTNEEIPQEEENFSPKIEKSSFVASPKGIGEVKEIRNGKAIVEIDGKKHQVEEDDLIQSPLPPKELADLYDDLISGIEHETGQEVSRNVEWAGYDPKSNELAYKPHGSDKLYAYGDISPEDVEKLTNFLTQRKSTGGNYIGAWIAGSKSPIGAAMYQLIKKLQSERGGKGNEYKNRYETIYSALEPAMLASKRRYAERKKKAKKPRSD